MGEQCCKTGQLDPGQLQNFLNRKQVCINGDCQSILQRYGADPKVTAALEAAVSQQSNRTAARSSTYRLQKEATQLARDYRAAVLNSGQVPTPAEIEQLKLFSMKILIINILK